MKAATRFLVLTAWACVLVSRPASAGIVFEQDPQPASLQSPWSSSGSPTGNDASQYTTYDDFSLAKAATITNLGWQGFSFDANTLGSTSLPIEGFRVGFYSNSGGQPGAMLCSETIGFTEQAAGSIDVFGNGQAEAVENYRGTLSTGFVAAAGTTYWLSIQAITDGPASWMWASGTGGDGTSYQALSGQDGGAFVRPGDRAITLASVPEPSSIVLSGIAALGALIGCRPRRPPCKSAGRGG